MKFLKANRIAPDRMTHSSESHLGLYWMEPLLLGYKPGLKVIKHFLCATQPSMKFQLLINTEIIKIGRIFMLRLAKPVIYPADKC